MVTIDDLIQSIQTNNVDLLKELINQIIINNQDINELKDNKNRIALHYAMTQENIEIIKILLEANSNPNAQDLDNLTPLHVAMQHDYEILPETINILIGAGANVNSAGQYNFTPLHIAADYTLLDAANTLVQAGADVNALDNDNQTPLHLASRCRTNTTLLTKLIQAGANINAIDNNNSTPLHLAASNSLSPQSSYILIFANADINLQNNQGFSALTIAQNRERPITLWQHIILKNFSFAPALPWLNFSRSSMALNLPKELNTLILSYLADPTEYPDVNEHLNNLFFSYQRNFRLKQQQTSNSAKIEEIEKPEEAIIPDYIAISATKSPVLTSYRPDRKIRAIRPKL